MYWHWNGLLCADVPLRNCSLTHFDFIGFLGKTDFMGFEQLLLRLCLFSFDASCATTWFLYGDAVRIWARTAIRLHFLLDVDRGAEGFGRSWTGVTLWLLCGDAAPVNQNWLLTTQGYHTRKKTDDIWGHVGGFCQLAPTILPQSI